MGGDATTIIFSDQVMENGSLLKYNGDSFFEGSLVEPLSCVVGAFNAQYHMKKMYSYEHVMGIKEGGAIALLGATGPNGIFSDRLCNPWTKETKDIGCHRKNTEED